MTDKTASVSPHLECAQCNETAPEPGRERSALEDIVRAVDEADTGTDAEAAQALGAVRVIARRGLGESWAGQ
jgi:hypothetical protein